MAIESFDVEDENGVRVTGTVEVYRDPNGDYYNPNSESYQNPRFSDVDINYLNTRDVCRINPDKLKEAVAEAFAKALVKSGMPDPRMANVLDKVGIATALRATGSSRCHSARLRRSLSDLALIPGTIARSFLVALCFSIGGSNAFADMLPGATCPPDFTCFSIEPRDGTCRHPAVVLDEQAKSTVYQGDRFSRAFEKACIAKTNSLATRRGNELHLKLSDGAAKLYKDNQGKAACENDPGCKTYLLYDYFPEHGLFLVHVGYDEDQEWLLVNQVDGKEQKVVAPPGYSPNKKWLASVSSMRRMAATTKTTE